MRCNIKRKGIICFAKYKKNISKKKNLNKNEKRLNVRRSRIDTIVLELNVSLCSK